MVPKPGKADYSLPKCYRPVALLECMGKLLEKVIAKRISHDITALGLIPTTQFGARPFSSTIDAGLCLTHDIETAHPLGGVCGTLLFDIEGFFDNVNHARLTALVRALGFPPEICAWTTSFLRDRSVRIRFNNFTSDSIDLEMGTPQGSPISPILSIIYACFTNPKHGTTRRSTCTWTTATSACAPTPTTPLPEDSATYRLSAMTGAAGRV